MSTLVVTSYQGTSGLGSSAHVQIFDPSTGATLVARTNGGIREDKAGCYVYSTTLADLDAYEAVWDEGAAPFAVEIVYPRPPVVVNVVEGSPLPVIGDANGTLLAKTFLIKRNDTRPYLRRQLVDTNGNAITLSSSDTVMFTMRTSTDVAMAGSAKVHAAAVIIDASQAIVEYRWATADTNTTTYVETSTLGRVTDTPYAGEFEVTFIADGTIETFPQGDYIAISIPPDLDPGINP